VGGLMAVLLRVQSSGMLGCVSGELLTEVSDEHGVTGPFIVDDLCFIAR